MAAEVFPMSVGPLPTNCYLLACGETRQAAVIDPGDESWRIQAELEERHWSLQWILVTHAHFDHMAACKELADACGGTLALHPADLPLWWIEGGSQLFGLSIPKQPEPAHTLKPGELLALGRLQIEVLHLPGHSPGHVGFLLREEGWLFSGDVVFAEGGMGRFDLPGASEDVLLETIQRKVFSLPDSTRIFPGHGEETTVGAEKRNWDTIARSMTTTP
jgi:hydroxyacylglutathione hydrolase